MEDTAALPGRVLTCARGSPKDAPRDGASWDLRRCQGLAEQWRSGARDPRPAAPPRRGPRARPAHRPRTGRAQQPSQPPRGRCHRPAAEAAAGGRVLPGRRRPRPEPQPHVVRVDSSFRRRGPARHGRAAGGRARLPARAPEPAAGARHRQGPRGGSPWLLPGPPAARPGSSPRPSHPLARR